MVGSIDPRCETVRGTHWPKQGRWRVWNSRRGSHLGQRSNVTASTGRTYGCKRSDQTSKTLAARGPSTYGSRPSPGRPERSHPQIPMLQIGLRDQLLRRPAPYRASALDDVMAVGDAGEVFDVLVDH